MRLDSLDTEQFIEWLQSRLGTLPGVVTLSAVATDALREIDGETASGMSEEDWENHVPQTKLGTRRKILKQIAECKAAETATD